MLTFHLTLTPVTCSYPAGRRAGVLLLRQTAVSITKPKHLPAMCELYPGDFMVSESVLKG